MKIPTIEGTIDRRILINFSIDKEVLARFLPSPFKPKLINDRGIAGICLIRLKDIRPLGFPEIIGIGSENAAHRIAVEWTEDGQTKEGVYIPRRDTDSLLNHWTGGHLFPGVHHLSKFDVEEKEGTYRLSIKSKDNNSISISARQSDEFNKNSVFGNLEAASDFFRNGSVGFSPNRTSYDGLELKTMKWKVSPLVVDNVSSSFFENETVFPKGSVVFDNALLMLDIKHKWDSYEKCPCP
jgi:hypothetical protein